jgi:putative peptide zinc metalloprotease protein
LFNANPLLRYDGYYILSDLIEIPNLRQKSRSVFSRVFSTWCLGLKPQPDPFMPQRRLALFAAFAAASSIYGWIVRLSIFLFVWNVFKPYRLEVLGQALGWMALWGLVIRPLRAMIEFLRVPGKRDEVKLLNLSITVVVAAAMLAAIALVPLPQRVWCAAEMRPRGEETVYVTVPGTLERIIVKPGDRVTKGQELLVLSNVDLDLAIADLSGKAAKYRARLDSLIRERFTDPAAAREVGTVEEALKSVEEQLAKKHRDRGELVIVAPRDGEVLPPARVPPRPDPNGQLSTWAGSPLDERNAGATLSQGTVVCLVGEPAVLEAVMVVDQTEVEFVAPGQRVDLKIDALPWQTFTGRIDDIAQSHIEVGSERLSVKAGGSVPTETDEAGREVPISTSYEVMMNLPEGDPRLTAVMPGMRGVARIRVGQRTVGQWLLRLLWQTFNFRM